MDLTHEDIDEDALRGHPSPDVPAILPDEKCRGKRTTGHEPPIFQGYCKNVCGKGTDHLHEGRCKNHGGSIPTKDENPAVGNGDQDGNLNALKHGAWADKNTLYRKGFTDDERAMVDAFEADYHERYEDVHGTEPLRFEAFRLAQISIHHVVELRADEWPFDRPDDRNSPHPFVDRKAVPGEFGETVEYETSAAQTFMVTLTSKDRQWLKDMSLLPDPESKQAEATGSLATALEQAIDRTGGPV